ncbi:hypothetical protein [Bradyrhizobium sp. UFLA05-112]
MKGTVRHWRVDETHQDRRRRARGHSLYSAPWKDQQDHSGHDGGVVSHAMICVQHGSFIDSTSSGVQARNLQRELFENDEKAFHFRLKNPPDRKVLEQIVDYARSEIGARYSISEAARSVAAAITGRMNFRISDFDAGVAAAL